MNDNSSALNGAADRRLRNDLRFRPGQMASMFGDTAAAMIVDDDAPSAEVLAGLLGSAGYTCTIASDPTRARTLLGQEDFALALVDVTMSAGPGLDLMADMLVDHPDIAVVMVTAVEDPKVAELALERGAYGYVLKPFRPSPVLITASNAGRRRCLEILRRRYEERLERHIGEQALDLEDALIQLKEIEREASLPASEMLMQALGSQVKLRALVDAAPEGILGIDGDGYIDVVNTHVERLSGYQRDELLGRRVDVLIPVGVDLVVDQPRASTLVDALPRQTEAVLRRKDGVEVPVEVNLSAIESAEGVLVSATVRDLTGHIRARDERERLERRLHQTARLDSLGQLAGGVAHNFNNLLAIILNYTSFVSEQVTAAAAEGGDRWPAVRDDVEQIRVAAERAANLTRQVLAFGRRQIVFPEIVDLNAIVADIQPLVESSASENVEMATSLAPDLWPVMIDPAQITHALLSLALNANAAMPAGGTVTITTENALIETVDPEAGPPPGRYVRFCVVDTGAGMDPAVLAHAFEPFFTTSSSGSSGLGLATVHGIITQAGGYAEITSEPGAGTTFTALIPATDEAVSPADRSGHPPHLPGTRTVLLVEHDDAMREITRRLLARNGYEVLPVDGGDEAVTLASRHQGTIDLLVTDIHMPETPGQEVARQVKALLPAIRVLYLSGALPGLGSRRGLDAGAAVVEKPFTESELLTALDDVVDG